MENNSRKKWKLGLQSFLTSIVVYTMIWVGFHGIPLLGLPEKEQVEWVSIVCEGEEKTITEEADIELLVTGANLLNYKLWGEPEGEPVLVVTYHLENGKEVTLAANGTTMWWHGKAHAIKEPDCFVRIMRGLFFRP